MTTPHWHRKIAQAGAEFLPPSSACVVRFDETGAAEVVTRYYKASAIMGAREKAHGQVTRLENRDHGLANYYVVSYEGDGQIYVWVVRGHLLYGANLSELR